MVLFGVFCGVFFVWFSLFVSILGFQVIVGCFVLVWF